MGKKDTVTAKYMRKNQVFADAFNYYVYHGEQKIHPEELVELDTKEIEVLYRVDEVEKNSKAVMDSKAAMNSMVAKDSEIATDSMAARDSMVATDSKIAADPKVVKASKTAKNSLKPIQKTRDVLKGIVAMKDRRSIYLILGIENQSNIHYAMPVRNMLYDALQYDKQVEEVIQSHRQADDYVNAKSDEFLSGFMKEDRIVPILTLVIYWDSKAWDGPLSIHEMCRDWDEELMALVPDYRINLLAPALIKDEDFDKFHSSLKEVLSFIKYSGDKEMLRKHMSSHDSFHHMGRDEVNVLNACVNAGISIDEEGEGEVDMCQALLDIKEEGKIEGRTEGRIESLTRMAKNLMQNMHWSDEKAMNALGFSDEERKIIAPRLQ